ncbi:MAG: protein kinase, partial [Planctomycetota bacterium]
MPPADPDSLQKVAQYRLDALVARGGVGVVYRATDETLDRTVALKVLGDPTLAEVLIAEARHVSRLSHPSIAGVYQAGIDKESGIPFIAFEWVNGVTLRSHLRNGPLPLEEFYRYARDVALALAHAHEEHIVHGDLKADNIVVLPQGTGIKLLDFGLSTPDEEVDDGDLWGTPAYMAPELLAQGSRSQASDLFALGVLLFEMATDHLPFGGEDGDEHKVRQRQQERRVPNPRELRPELSASTAELISGLLAKDPGERGPSALEVGRHAQLQLRGKRRPIRALPLVGLVVILAVAWSQRHRFLSSPGSQDGTTVEQRLPRLFRVGEWLDPQLGTESPPSRLGADLLTLFVNGADPGSALLVPPTSEGEIQVLEGSWGKSQGNWVARFHAAGEDHVKRSSNPVTLAKLVAQQVIAENFSNRLATTLPDVEAPIAAFISGVRATEMRNFAEAHKLFSHALERAGAFPEAAAWQAALLLVEGRYESAGSLVIPLRGVESAPARVLDGTLGVPARQRSARWQRDHLLARLLDLTLSWTDPGTDDAWLQQALQRDGHAGLPSLPRMETTLRLRHGEVKAAQESLARYQSFLSNAYDWDFLVLRHWSLLLESGEEAADEALRDLFLEIPDANPALMLRVPYQLKQGKLEAALRLAAKGDVSLPQARRASVLVLAIGGQFEKALELAAEGSTPLDRGEWERLQASVEMLRGRTEAARGALLRAREIDPDHPYTEFLL